MSYKRPQKHRPDTTAPAIIGELETRGYVVIRIGRPVDVLVRHPSWPLNIWRLLECKSPSPNGQLRLRADQEEQQKFCTEHGVPYAMNGAEALHAMGEVVTL